MTPGQTFSEQVGLLVSLLPHIARQECFALKGGTAINLFFREMPRLSVEIAKSGENGRAKTPRSSG